MSTAVTNLDKPLIAAINGYCLGGAIKFILDCDMVIASEKSTFAHPEIKVGQQAGFYGLPFFFGKHRAMEFVLSGDRISARQAESWGLVNKVVPNETFRQEVENFVKRFTANSGILLSLVRQGLATVASKSPEEAKLELAKISSKIRESEDHREGMKAFAEKRPPQWKNR